jgi:hypothetical protein
MEWEGEFRDYYGVDVEAVPIKEKQTEKVAVVEDMPR